MDSTILEQLIATLMDKTFERLQVKDRVEQVTIWVGDPLGVQATITDGTSSRGSTWTVTATENEGKQW
jgi:hypothetical protein